VRVSAGAKLATGEVRRDTSYSASTASEDRRQSVVALLRTQFKAISKAQLDRNSTAKASDGDICVRSTHGRNHELGGLP
jgi:hypothetical protein